jgi:hypothetical protein
LTGIFAAVFKSGAHGRVDDDQRFLGVLVPLLAVRVGQDGHVDLLQRVGSSTTLLVEADYQSSIISGTSCVDSAAIRNVKKVVEYRF